jgi:3-hydroxyacyl-[acyl-carrier-protein] dehydratase
VRFVLVDRIVELDPGRSIDVLKNVSASEDVFEDHFPGCPIFPGAMLVEVFGQAAELLIGATYDFERVGSLVRLSRVSFRRFVRPGDQVRARCEKRSGDDTAWTISASATTDGIPVASGALELAIEEARDNADALARATRWREMARVLRDRPLELFMTAAVEPAIRDEKSGRGNTVAGGSESDA